MSFIIFINFYFYCPLNYSCNKIKTYAAQLIFIKPQTFFLWQLFNNLLPPQEVHPGVPRKCFEHKLPSCQSDSVRVFTHTFTPAPLSQY